MRRPYARMTMAGPGPAERTARDHAVVTRTGKPRRHGRSPDGHARARDDRLLVYRRRTVGPVFSATTRNDKIMYVLLVGTIVLGLGTTVLGNLTGDPHDCREPVSPWFRSIFAFQPGPALMTEAPIGFQLHALAAWVLFACWPFSRLVHVFSMPLGYLTRPYIGYRSRDARQGARAPKRGWERVR